MGLTGDGHAVASQRTMPQRAWDLAVFAAYYLASIPVALVTLLATIFVFVPVALLQTAKPPTGSTGSGAGNKAPVAPAGT